MPFPLIFTLYSLRRLFNQPQRPSHANKCNATHSKRTVRVLFRSATHCSTPVFPCCPIPNPPHLHCSQKLQTAWQELQPLAARLCPLLPPPPAAAATAAAVGSCRSLPAGCPKRHVHPAGCACSIQRACRRVPLIGRACAGQEGTSPPTPGLRWSRSCTASCSEGKGWSSGPLKTVVSCASGTRADETHDQGGGLGGLPPRCAACGA